MLTECDGLLICCTQQIVSVVKCFDSVLFVQAKFISDDWVDTINRYFSFEKSTGAESDELRAARVAYETLMRDHGDDLIIIQGNGRHQTTALTTIHWLILTTYMYFLSDMKTSDRTGIQGFVTSSIRLLCHNFHAAIQKYGYEHIPWTADGCFKPHSSEFFPQCLHIRHDFHTQCKENSHSL